MSDDEKDAPMEDEVDEPSTEQKPAEQGYLARDEFTSERFKLELSNLPKYFGFGVSTQDVIEFRLDRCLGMKK